MARGPRAGQQRGGEGGRLGGILNHGARRCAASGIRDGRRGREALKPALRRHIQVRGRGRGRQQKEVEASGGEKLLYESPDVDKSEANESREMKLGTKNDRKTPFKEKLKFKYAKNKHTQRFATTTTLCRETKPGGKKNTHNKMQYKNENRA